MSDVLLTHKEREDISHAAQLTIAHWAMSGLRPCGWMWTKDAGWDRALDLCGCNYPSYVVRDGKLATFLPKTTWN